MINLNNFESFVPYKILQRGEDCYASDFVSIEYAHHLKNTHSQQLIAIYTSLLTAYAEQNIGRKHYEFIASALSRMQKMNGEREAVTRLVADFRVAYKRRPAMMEELGRF